jgi:nitroreductase
MDVIDAIRSRTSIRGYKPDPVPQEVLREILEVATRAPSGMNTQSWEITVVTGEPLNNIRQDAAAMFSAGTAPNPDYQMESYQGVYKERQVALAMELFRLLGITREDKKQRMEWMMQGFGFFDAPAAIIVATDKSLEPAHSYTDVGILMQTICLTALSHGLGTCIMGQGVMYPDVVRKHTGIPESKRLFLSTPVGYPDPDFPANQLRTTRVPVEESVKFLGF